LLYCRKVPEIEFRLDGVIVKLVHVLPPECEYNFIEIEILKLDVVIVSIGTNDVVINLFELIN
jgi:hypothetical protein